MVVFPIQIIPLKILIHLLRLTYNINYVVGHKKGHTHNADVYFIHKMENILSSSYFELLNSKLNFYFML